MSDLITIRKVKIEDLMQVAEIVTKSWQTAYRGIIDDEYLDSLSVEKNYKKRLNDYNENEFIVAIQDKEVVGFCRYGTDIEYKEKYGNIDCEIYALYVKPENKRKGVGKALMTYVKDDFYKRGYAHMILWCLKDNHPARAFYEKMGGKYCYDGIISRGGKEYSQVGFVYDLKNITNKLK